MSELADFVNGTSPPHSESSRMEWIAAALIARPLSTKSGQNKPNRKFGQLADVEL